MGWCLRWNAMLPMQWMQDAWPYMFDVCPNSNLAEVDQCSKLWCSTTCKPADSFMDFMWMPMMAYAAWAIAHALFTQVVFKSYLEKENKTHLFPYMRDDKALAGLWKTTRKMFLPDVVTYYLAHFAVNMALGAVSWIYWQSFYLHTAWLLLLTFTACRNGASYTFKIFAVRYAPQKFKELGYMGVALGTEEEAVKTMKNRKLTDILRKARSFGKGQDESTGGTPGMSRGSTAESLAA